MKCIYQGRYLRSNHCLWQVSKSPTDSLTCYKRVKVGVRKLYLVSGDFQGSVCSSLGLQLNEFPE